MTVISLQAKKFPKSGSKLVPLFAEEFSAELFQRIKRYAEKNLQEGGLEHAFYYKEQQIKGHIAASIDSVCDSYFLQEPPVHRRKLQSGRGRKPKRTRYGRGRADYWCRYGDGVRVGVLIEIKHGWLSYARNRNCTPTSRSIDNHRNAKTQLKAIKKSHYVQDNLYAAAITGLPIWVTCKDAISDPVTLSKKEMGEIAEEVRKKFSAAFVHGWQTPKELNKTCTFIRDNGTKYYQSFPGVFLVWSINKVTRDRKSIQS